MRPFSAQRCGFRARWPRFAGIVRVICEHVFVCSSASIPPIGWPPPCTRRRNRSRLRPPPGCCCAAPCAGRPAAPDRRRGGAFRCPAGVAQRRGDRARGVDAAAPRARRRRVLRRRPRDHRDPPGRRPDRRDRGGAGRGLRAGRAVRAARRPRRPAACRDHAHHRHPPAGRWPAGRRGAGAPGLPRASRADAVLVAHNARFDVGFLDAELRRLRGRRLAGTVLDTVALARKLVPGRTRYSLSALADRFATGNGVRHRALPDALATAEILLALIGRRRSAAPRRSTDLSPCRRRRRGGRTPSAHWPRRRRARRGPT